MTTLTDRPRTALIIIDAQRRVLAKAWHRDEAVANMLAVLEKARASKAPVVWVQHEDDQLESGSQDWQLVPELAPLDSEAVVHKHYGDAFEGTDLEDVLEDAGVGSLVVAGAQSDECIRSTIHGGFTRGYDVTLVADAHTAEDLTEWGAPTPDKVIAHTNLYWSYQTAPGRTAAVTPAAEVAFA
ncbi:cysteine hydrolase [Glaciihabitans arcticus]|uniref:Cysteine hydrolase n=1 Tax=Glaciihabitans arcticus TaxID=2668039 RepID=A0A4Q9GWH8_9MICO|nr:cysteine hydrolase family protein [Glaciihabitans arcticus]TBN56580.1 cysteine hydrolase [Glaciihabitans arcticus]